MRWGEVSSARLLSRSAIALLIMAVAGFTVSGFDQATYLETGKDSLPGMLGWRIGIVASLAFLVVSIGLAVVAFRQRRRRP